MFFSDKTRVLYKNYTQVKDKWVLKVVIILLSCIIFQHKIVLHAQAARFFPVENIHPVPYFFISVDNTIFDKTFTF